MNEERLRYIERCRAGVWSRRATSENDMWRELIAEVRHQRRVIECNAACVDPECAMLFVWNPQVTPRAYCPKCKGPAYFSTIPPRYYDDPMVYQEDEES